MIKVEIINSLKRFSVTRSGWKTYLIRCSTSWKKVAVVVAMDRHVEDIRVVVEGLLGAVAMVNILKLER